VIFRWVLFAFILLASQTVGFAQGGFIGQGGGGGGFGGAGGGFGGSQGPIGSYSDESRLPMADRDPSDSFWQTRSAILTPGDRVEFRFSLKKGETILAGATSEAFDPALAVTDAGGKELLRNDDRKEGNQDPFVNFKAPADGDYLLKVLSYRSVAGGKFEVRMRSLHPTDVPLTRAENVPVHIQSRERSYRFALRIPVKAGTTYDLSGIQAKQENNPVYFSSLKIIGPIGIPSEEYRSFGGTFANIIESKVDGELILEYSAPNSIQVSTNFQAVPVTNFGTSQKLSLPAERDQTVRLEIPVKKLQIVRTIIRSAADSLITPKRNEAQSELYRVDDSSGAKASPWFAIQKRQGEDRDVTRVYQADDTMILLVRNKLRDTKIEVENTEFIPDFTSEQPAKADLAIGDTHVYRLKTTKGELVRYEYQVQGFLLNVSTYALTGAMANRPVASADVLYQESDDYLVVVSCVGHGGSGSYQITQKVIPPPVIRIGEATKTVPNREGTSYVAVKLEANQSYEAIVEPMASVQGGYAYFQLVNPGGTSEPVQTLVTSKATLNYFTPKESAVYRVWIRSSGTGVRLKIRPFKIPTVDDK